jgi:hypothetical protein
VRGHRQASLNEILLEGCAGKSRQRDLASLAAFADEIEPVGAMFTGRNVPKSCADEFARPQTGRIGEVEQETQSLCGRCSPAVGPLQSVGDRANQPPFAFREAARRIERRYARVAADLDAGKRIGEDVALFDEPAVEDR